MKTSRSGKHTHRCFMAIPIELSVGKQLMQWVKSQSGKPEYANLNWVPLDNLHITLHFLGNLSAHEISDIQNTLHQQQLIHTPIPLAVNTLSAFPNTQNQRFFVASIQPNDALLALRERIADVLDSLGHPLEKRAFRPHITVGRWSHRNNDPAITSVSFQAVFNASSYALFESINVTDPITHKTHPIYHSLGEFG